MIQIKNLTKKFDHFTALDGLHLQVRKGSIYGLVGTNGAGKTTAIKHLAGVYRANAGDVTIDGQPVYDNAGIKRRVGYIADELYFFPFYTAAMQRGFLRRMYGAQWNDGRYAQLCQLMQLDEQRRLSKLSKGQQKQAAFVFALSAMPDVMLLDEPIDGLDPLVRKVVFDFIIEDVAQRGMTVLISSHNLKEMDGICDAVGIIKNGRMAIERDLDDLKSEVHKIQLAFARGEAETALPTLDILHHERRGGVHLLVVRGQHDVIEAQIRAMQPTVYDHLPLTLEEVFIYENRAAQDALKNERGLPA